MTNPNPELAAAWEAVPERAAVEAALASVRERKASMKPTVDPESARQAVIGAAVDALCDGEALPKDLGKKAADAFTSALAAQAEWAAVCTAEATLKDRLSYTMDVWRDDALEALGERLADILADVRAIVARSGRLVDGDAAIAAGPTGLADYEALRKLLVRLSNLRAAQRSILKPLFRDDPQAFEMAAAYRAGMDEVTGLRTNPAPEHIEAVITGKAPRDIEYMIWLSECGRAYVPASTSELLAQRFMAEVGTPDSYVHILNPRVTPARPAAEQPRAPRSTDERERVALARLS
jgi:hypothetical protein